jgi:hypothetical protein
MAVPLAASPIGRSCTGLWQARVLIDFDPVVSHLRMHNLTCCLRNDYVGLLSWHVAMHALVHDHVAQRFRHATVLPLMAGEAFL